MYVRSSMTFVAPSNPSSQNQKPSYWSCVGNTIQDDAIWAGTYAAVLGVGVETVAGGVAGSEGGPPGVLAGAGTGFVVGTAAAPVNFGMGAVASVPAGVVHGLIGCAF